MTLLEHLIELRRRLLWVGLFFVAGMTAAWTGRQMLTDIILAPLGDQKLVYLTPGGGLSFVLQITVYAGMLVALPVLLYHVYAFIRPALPRGVRYPAARIMLFGLSLMLCGIAYGYFVALPAALRFLAYFAGDAITPNVTADAYLSFFLTYTGGLAVLSLLPLVLLLWNWIHPLGPGGLLRSERWVILFAFIAAAIVTPTPDVVNQTMIAGPVIGIYQLGVAAVLVARRRSGKAATARPAVVTYSKKALPAPVYALEVSDRPRTVAKLGGMAAAASCQL